MPRITSNPLYGLPRLVTDKCCIVNIVIFVTDVARGCTGCMCTPGAEKKFGRNL